MRFNCDREGCGYSLEITPDSAISVSKEEICHLIEKVEEHKLDVCPRCGDRLLNDIDYKQTIGILKFMKSPPVRFINWIGRKFHMKRNRISFKSVNGEISVEYQELNRDGNGEAEGIHTRGRS